MQNEYDFDQDTDVKRQEQALTIVAFTETIEALIQNFEPFVESLSREHQAEGKVYLSKLKALYSTLSDNTTDISKALVNSDNLTSKYPSKIKRLGIASDLIKAVKQQGLTVKACSDRFGISPQSIKQFFEVYDAASPAERVKITRNDVYDIERNMQNVHAMLLRLMSRFEADGDISAKLIGEYRQILTMAERQQKEWNRIRQNQLSDVVCEILAHYCNKESRALVLQKFRDIGVKGLSPAQAEPKPIVEVIP
jgi:hypothetical protein